MTWLLLLGCGAAATLVLYAVSSYYLNRNLHGRYLVGLYLSMLGIFSSVLPLLPQVGPHSRWSHLARGWSIVVVGAAIHAYALRFILFRYF